MDQLELLKSKWQAQEAFPKVSHEKIKSLLHSKSSSIVKWLLYIAIGEFVLFSGLGAIAHVYNEDHNLIEILTPEYYYGTGIFHYVCILIFIYLFYKNYQLISTDQPSRTLMKNILRTRKTMKYYIWYNILYMIVVGMITMVLAVNNDPQMLELQENLKDVDHTTFMLILLGISFIMYSVIGLFLFLFYQLIYGILLRRLRENYTELKKMEV